MTNSPDDENSSFECLDAIEQNGLSKELLEKNYQEWLKREWQKQFDAQALSHMN